MGLHLEGITAWIATDGQMHPSHCKQKPLPNFATCWIGSEAGKRFSVNWAINERVRPLQATIFVDGVECGKYNILDATSYPSRPDVFEISSVRTSPLMQRDFMFSKMELTDQAWVYDAFGDDPNLGTITLEFWHLQVFQVETQDFVPHCSQLAGPRAVHSRSLMAGNHHALNVMTRFSDEYISAVPIVDIVKGYRVGTSPWATFTFNYRPMDVLKAYGIVPNVPKELKIILYRSVGEGRLQAGGVAFRSEEFEACNDDSLQEESRGNGGVLTPPGSKKGTRTGKKFPKQTRRLRAASRNTNVSNINRGSN